MIFDNTLFLGIHDPNIITCSTKPLDDHYKNTVFSLFGRDENTYNLFDSWIARYLVEYSVDPFCKSSIHEMPDKIEQQKKDSNNQ